jgi:methionyl-tRNA synthetase
MKNLHLVPVNVIDLVEKINDKSIRENEKNNYVLRLEATAAYIAEALSKNANVFSNNRKKTAR